jgi:hypothetical protein
VLRAALVLSGSSSSDCRESTAIQPTDPADSLALAKREMGGAAISVAYLKRSVLMRDQGADL